MTKKQKIGKIIVDANKKCEGIPDHLVGSLDSSYHFIEELCISAHALSIQREMLAQYTDKEREKLTAMCDKAMDIISGEAPQLAYTAMEIMFVNCYARLFDMGIVSLFNEVKMEREAIAHKIYNIRKGEQTPAEPTTKNPSGVEVA